MGWLFGVSSQVYKRAVLDALNWLGCIARCDLKRAFSYETNLWFSAGFIRTRYKDFVKEGDGTHWTELVRFARALTRRLILGPATLSKRHPEPDRQSKPRQEIRPTRRRLDRDSAAGCSRLRRLVTGKSGGVDIRLLQGSLDESQRF